MGGLEIPKSLDEPYFLNASLTCPDAQHLKLDLAWEQKILFSTNLAF